MLVTCLSRYERAGSPTARIPPIRVRAMAHGDIGKANESVEAPGWSQMGRSAMRDIREDARGGAARPDEDGAYAAQGLLQILRTDSRTFAYVVARVFGRADGHVSQRGMSRLPTRDVQEAIRHRVSKTGTFFAHNNRASRQVRHVRRTPSPFWKFVTARCCRSCVLVCPWKFNTHLTLGHHSIFGFDSEDEPPSSNASAATICVVHFREWLAQI